MTLEGSYSGFDLEMRENGVAVITFNHPERLNAITQAGRWDLDAVLTMAQFDDDVRVIVITGTGKGFIAGVGGGRGWENEPPVAATSLPRYRNLPINRYEILVHLSQQGARTVRRLDKLTIAAVNGYAIQWGLSLALACDFVICARSAQLASATLRTAFQPDEGGHWLLVQHLGVRKALEFMMLNKFVTGEEAVQMGLANEVTDDEQLMERALELAGELAKGPQVAMRLLKKATYLAAELTFDQAGEDIGMRTALTDFHEDTEEGHDAFWNKPRREPVFNKWLEEDGPW